MRPLTGYKQGLQDLGKEAPFGLGHARKVFMERLAWRLERF